VAERAIEAGAEMINDISGLHFDQDLGKVAAKEDVPLILMHIRGTPETMQKDVHYESLFSEILQYLKESIQRAESAGLDPQQIIIDPGIGFGKTLEDNLLIIKNLSEFRILGKPILLGTSRKSFIGKILNVEVNPVRNSSGALNPAGIILKCNPAAEQRGIISNGVNERLEGTLSSIAICVLNGAHIIRCHDVLQAKKAIAVADAIRLAGT